MRTPRYSRFPFRTLVVLALLGGCAGKGSGPRSDGNGGTTPSATVPGGAPIQLTSSAGDQASPAFFPEGNRLVYQNNSDGNWELYELDLATATPRRITDSPENEEDPSVSADGQWILCTVHPPALEQDPPRDIILISKDGKTRRLLVGGPADDWFPRFTPDGQSVLFVSDRVETRADQADSERRSALFRISLDGGQPEQLTEGQDESAPWPLADGSVVYRDHKGHLQKRGADGSVNKLYDGAWIVGHPVTTPSGQFWLAGSENLDSPGRILRGDASLASLLPIELGSRQEDRGPAVSPDGRSLAFYGRSDGQWDLYLLDAGQP
jgi:Tol biopolymer transport system component